MMKNKVVILHFQTKSCQMPKILKPLVFQSLDQKLFKWIKNNLKLKPRATSFILILNALYIMVILIKKCETSIQAPAWNLKIYLVNKWIISVYRTWNKYKN